MLKPEVAKLDTNGRCCGSKPALVYEKRSPRLYCSKCDREFDANTGQQVASWFYKAAGDGFVHHTLFRVWQEQQK